MLFNEANHIIGGDAGCDFFMELRQGRTDDTKTKVQRLGLGVKHVSEWYSLQFSGRAPFQ